MISQKNKEIPTEKIQQMQSQGLQNQDIISNLQKEGYKHEQISQAMDHVAIKGELPDTGMNPIQRSPTEDIPVGLLNAPSPSVPQKQYEPEPQQQPEMVSQEEYGTPTGFSPEPLERASYDAIEEIAESIIKEKWDELIKGVGDIALWKERIDIDLEGVKQELIRTQEKFENLQKSVMGKVSEYSEGVINVGTEMKALERVLEKILSPLTRSVKDLQEVSEKLAKKTPRKRAKRKPTKKKATTKKKKK